MEGPYFGTYHHSTLESSESQRNVAKELFFQAFSKLPFDRKSNIYILDVGCGLGFLTWFVSSYFTDAKIVAIDNFEDPSLIGSSYEGIVRNMRLLGISERVEIRKHDITEKFESEMKFDLALSNLVLHNTGRKRFIVYSNIREVLKKDGFFLNGDLFIRTNLFVDKYAYDMNNISRIFRPEFVLRPEKNTPISKYYKLVALKAI